MHGFYFRASNNNGNNNAGAYSPIRTSDDIVLTKANQAEFIAYFLLFQIGNRGEVTRYLLQIPESILSTPEMKFAIAVWTSIRTNNFCDYFRLLKRANLLQACLMHRYLKELRFDAIKAISKSLFLPSKLEPKTYIPIIDIQNMLMFESLEETGEFLEHCGIEVDQIYDNDSDFESNSKWCAAFQGQNLDSLLPRDKNDFPILPRARALTKCIGNKARTAEDQPIEAASICQGSASSNFKFDQTKYSFANSKGKEPNGDQVIVTSTEMDRLKQSLLKKRLARKSTSPDRDSQQTANKSEAMKILGETKLQADKIIIKPPEIMPSANVKAQPVKDNALTRASAGLSTDRSRTSSSPLTTPKQPSKPINKPPKVVSNNSIKPQFHEADSRLNAPWQRATVLETTKPSLKPSYDPFPALKPPVQTLPLAPTQQKAVVPIQSNNQVPQGTYNIMPPAAPRGSIAVDPIEKKMSQTEEIFTQNKFSSVPVKSKQTSLPLAAQQVTAVNKIEYEDLPVSPRRQQSLDRLVEKFSFQKHHKLRRRCFYLWLQEHNKLQLQIQCWIHKKYFRLWKSVYEDIVSSRAHFFEAVKSINISESAVNRSSEPRLNLLKSMSAIARDNFCNDSQVIFEQGLMECILKSSHSVQKSFMMQLCDVLISTQMSYFPTVSTALRSDWHGDIQLNLTIFSGAQEAGNYHIGGSKEDCPYTAMLRVLLADSSMELNKHHHYPEPYFSLSCDRFTSDDNDKVVASVYEVASHAKASSLVPEKCNLLGCEDLAILCFSNYSEETNQINIATLKQHFRSNSNCRVAIVILMQQDSGNKGSVKGSNNQVHSFYSYPTPETILSALVQSNNEEVYLSACKLMANFQESCLSQDESLLGQVIPRTCVTSLVVLPPPSSSSSSISKRSVSSSVSDTVSIPLLECKRRRATPLWNKAALTTISTCLKQCLVKSFEQQINNTSDENIFSVKKMFLQRNYLSHWLHKKVLLPIRLSYSNVVEDVEKVGNIARIVFDWIDQFERFFNAALSEYKMLLNRLTLVPVLPPSVHQPLRVCLQQHSKVWVPYEFDVDESSLMVMKMERLLVAVKDLRARLYDDLTAREDDEQLLSALQRFDAQTLAIHPEAVNPLKFEEMLWNMRGDEGAAEVKAEIQDACMRVMMKALDFSSENRPSTQYVYELKDAAMHGTDGEDSVLVENLRAPSLLLLSPKPSKRRPPEAPLSSIENRSSEESEDYRRYKKERHSILDNILMPEVDQTLLADVQDLQDTLHKEMTATKRTLNYLQKQIFGA